MNYYYAKGDEVLGPKSLEELVFRAEEIGEDTQVCAEGSESWQPLSALIPIEQPSPPAIVQPPPVPPASPLPGLPPPIINQEYYVVPFVATVKLTDDTSVVAAQLQQMIRYHVGQGWDYVRLESVETHVAGDSGCFGIGATPERTTVCSMVVFKR